MLASSSLSEVLAAVDAVYIGTTPSSHAQLTLEALAAGKHVLLEKPLAALASDADVIVAASERAQTKVGLNIGMLFLESAITPNTLMISNRVIPSTGVFGIVPREIVNTENTSAGAGVSTDPVAASAVAVNVQLIEP